MDEQKFYKEVYRLALNSLAVSKDPRLKALAASSDFLSELLGLAQYEASKAFDRSIEAAGKIAQNLLDDLRKSL